MDILSVLTIAGATIGSCYYFRKETKEQLKEIREESREQSRDISRTLGRIELEQRDFHGRLCALEERYHQLLERMWDDRRKGN